MGKYQLDLVVRSVRTISSDTFLLELTMPGTGARLPEVQPGQFAEFLVRGSETTFLRRPISIHDVDYQNNAIYFLIRKAGAGTAKMSELKTGDTINVILPLGNGFDYATTMPKHPLLVGGGVGVAPLLLLGKAMKSAGIRPEFLFGGRGKDNLLRIDEYGKSGKVHVTTEDGSCGQKGFVTDHTVLKEESFDCIYSCGPTPMMKAVASYASEKGIPCQVSLEHKMACGIGACLCCVEDTKDGNVCVCKEGPVFNTEKLLWQN
ncbi:MAG: dihydroorotate dehydrogenase electron transfer subunit [Bacteroidaceae bacterium]|nr:dihydroorotate dehydrogenase electron transfer subunit [Bacteroidaceae bacterium]